MVSGQAARVDVGNQLLSEANTMLTLLIALPHDDPHGQRLFGRFQSELDAAGGDVRAALSDLLQDQSFTGDVMAWLDLKQ